MPGEAAKRQLEDEDTVVGFQGHMTNQTDEAPEQFPDDRNRRQAGPERTPNHPEKKDERKTKKPNRSHRK